MKNFIISVLGGLIGALIVFSITVAITSNDAAVETIVTNSENNNATEVYSQAVNGVVTVLNYQSQQTLQQFLNGESGNLVESGIGSGFIYKKENGYYYALTNNHVIANSENIKILANEQDIEDDLAEAEVVGSDDVYDVAVIRFKSNLDLTILNMGDSDKVQTGESVYAIGSPYGTDFAGSISSGILSAPVRKFEQYSHSYEYLQTDTAINPGNSGGPLLNSNGEVIGINSMKIADTESDNMGFAIPINMALDIAESLEAGEIPSDNDSFLDNYEIRRKDKPGDSSEDSSESQDDSDETTVGDLVREFLR